jgi:hypothetical protein
MKIVVVAETTKNARDKFPGDDSPQNGKKGGSWQPRRGTIADRAAPSDLAPLLRLGIHARLRSFSLGGDKELDVTQILQARPAPTLDATNLGPAPRYQSNVFIPSLAVRTR